MNTQTKVFLNLVAAAALFLALMLSGPAEAQSGSDDPLAKRVAMVHTLLYDSSAAKQIMNNGSEPALA